MKRILHVSCALLLDLGAWAQFENPLFIPDTLTGSTFNLTVDEGAVQFLPGDSTATYGINEPYLAPTIFLNKGDFVQLNVTNLLADTTTMHWHGLHGKILKPTRGIGVVLTWIAIAGSAGYCIMAAV